MKIYLVWYKEEHAMIEHVRGAAYNWQRAERMALNLELHMRSIGKEVTVGVKTCRHGDIYLDGNMWDNKWTKEQFEENEQA